jgi:hypothetical protein
VAHLLPPQGATWPRDGGQTYGTIENIVAIEGAGIRAFFPLPDLDHRTAF